MKVILLMVALLGCKNNVDKRFVDFLGGAHCEYAGDYQRICSRKGERIFCVEDGDKISCWFLERPVEGFVEDASSR